MVNSKILEELSDVAAQLNSKSNNLSTQIQALNDQPQALNLGLEYWLESPRYRIQDSGRRRESFLNSLPRNYREFTLLG